MPRPVITHHQSGTWGAPIRTSCTPASLSRGCSARFCLHPPPFAFAGAPGPPGVPILVRYSSAIAIHWSSGDPGKGPVTRYVIEARPSGMLGATGGHSGETYPFSFSLSSPTWCCVLSHQPRRCWWSQSEAREQGCGWEVSPRPGSPRYDPGSAKYDLAQLAEHRKLRHPPDTTGSPRTTGITPKPKEESELTPCQVHTYPQHC